MASGILIKKKKVRGDLQLAAIESLLINPARKIEAETIMMVTEISELKNRFLELLSIYGAQRPQDIELKIIAGEIPEHPSYEDYLSALSYEQGISELKKRLIDAIEEIGHL